MRLCRGLELDGSTAPGALAHCSRNELSLVTNRSEARAIGGGERDRTDDLLLAKQALSQLSYTPGFGSAEPGGVRRLLAIAESRSTQGSGANRAETQPGAVSAPGHCWRNVLPPTCFKARSALKQWWAEEDLNLRPHAYQARALTN
jgi:hypothetical protein